MLDWKWGQLIGDKHTDGQRFGNYYVPYVRHHNPLLIRNRSLTIHNALSLRKKPLEKTFLDFKKWVKIKQTAGYNSRRTIDGWTIYKLSIIIFENRTKVEFCHSQLLGRFVTSMSTPMQLGHTTNQESKLRYNIQIFKIFYYIQNWPS